MVGIQVIILLPTLFSIADIISNIDFIIRRKKYRKAIIILSNKRGSNQENNKFITQFCNVNG